MAFSLTLRSALMRKLFNLLYDVIILGKFRSKELLNFFFK